MLNRGQIIVLAGIFIAFFVSGFVSQSSPKWLGKSINNYLPFKLSLMWCIFVGAILPPVIALMTLVDKYTGLDSIGIVSTVIILVYYISFYKNETRFNY